MNDLAEIHGLNTHSLPLLSDDELQAIYDDLDDDTPNLELLAIFFEIEEVQLSDEHISQSQAKTPRKI